MKEFKNENENTINKQTIQSQLKSQDESSEEPNAVMTFSSSQCGEFEEFNNLMKNVVDSIDNDFLQGKENLIEHLISKYSSTPLENINKCEAITLRLCKNINLLSDFGKYLTNLIELNLSGSVINEISEIGTTFKMIKVLNVSNCNLKDLSGNCT